MTKSQKRLFLISISLLVFVLNANFALALEAKYPSIPFAPTISSSSEFPDYVSYLFTLGIYLAAFLAVVSMAVGGIQLIMSGENPDNAGKGKDRIKGSVLGLALTLAAFIILRTINPVLVTPVTTPLGEVAGIYYTNGSDTKPSPQSETNTSNIPEGYESLTYKCPEKGYAPNILIWEYPSPNFMGNDENYEGVVVKELSCGNTEGLGNVGSFKVAFKTPGVYFCMGRCSGDRCSGNMSGVIPTNQDNIESPFKNNIRSVWVVNDRQNEKIYGFILHKEMNQSRGGECTGSRFDPDKNSWCVDVNMSASSATIFTWNPYVNTSGDGAIFYSAPYGWKSDAQAGFSKITNNEIGKVLNKRAEELTFSYSGVARTQDYQNSCKTFRDCPWSMKIQGNYLVGLYTEGQTNNDDTGCLCDDGTFSFDCCSDMTKNKYYCQIYTKDVPDLGKEEFRASGSGRNADWVVVIPIK
jgi:hypothetical protein